MFDFFKKKPKAQAAQAEVSVDAGKSKSVLRFFTTFLIMMPLLALALVFAVDWWARHSVQESSTKALEAAAQATRSEMSVLVKGKVELAESVARQARVRSALTGKDKTGLKTLETALYQDFPGALMVQVIARESVDEALLSELSGSFAAREAHMKVMSTGKTQPVEALKGADKKEVMLVTVPVHDGQELLGSLMVRYPLTMLRTGVTEINIPGAAIAVEQEAMGVVFQLAASKGFAPAAGLDSIPVPGTLWRVTYLVVPEVNTDILVMLGAAALVIGLMVALLIADGRQLAKAIKADLGLTVTLMDSTLKRKGTPSCTPRLSESLAAIELLTKYAQATYLAGKADAGITSRAGMPQHVVAESIEVSEVGVEEAHGMTEAELPANLFTDCGLMGRVGAILTPKLAQELGQALGTSVLEAGGRALYLARDVGPNSVDYANSLIAGILASGCDVVDLGAEPYGVLSLATATLQHSFGVMVTHSDAPLDYLGFRIIMSGAELSSEGLIELRQLMLSGRFKKGTGNLETRNVRSEYIRQIGVDIQVAEQKKIVVDAGNSVAGQLAVRVLESLGAEVIQLFTEPDGNYPNHAPDVLDSANLSALILEVQAHSADFGLAFNGDGTALALVDEQGCQVPQDKVFMLLMMDIIRRQPGADVVYDQETTSNMAGFVLASGGRPIMAASAPCVMMEKINQTEALIGGTNSGRMFFKDRWFGGDDAIYAAARLLELLAADPLQVSEYFSDFPAVASAPRYEVSVPDGQLDIALQSIRKQGDFSASDIIELDGIRAEFVDSWVSIRPDGALSRLSIKMEGQDETALQQIKDRMRQAIKKALPQARLAF